MNGQNSDVAVTGPGGVGIKIKGRDTIIMLLLAATLGWFVYTTRQEHQAIVNELSTVSYLMSLKPEDRPRLTPPAHLWKRIEGR